MSLRCGWGTKALLLACLTGAACGGAASADGPAFTTGGGCSSGDCSAGGCATGGCGSWCSCCPKYFFTIEKPPQIRYHRVCSKPVCDPCDIEGYGYYPTCWRPWAYPPNYSACPVPPPGALASQPPPLIVEPGAANAPDFANVPGAAKAPAAEPDETLPAPKKTANPNPDR